MNLSKGRFPERLLAAPVSIVKPWSVTFPRKTSLKKTPLHFAFGTASEMPRPGADSRMADRQDGGGDGTWPIMARECGSGSSDEHAVARAAAGPSACYDD